MGKVRPILCLLFLHLQQLFLHLNEFNESAGISCLKIQIDSLVYRLRVPQIMSFPLVKQWRMFFKDGDFTRRPVTHVEHSQSRGKTFCI